MLLGMFKGSFFGASTTAILIRTGHAAAAATVLDGYPLAQKGKGAKAMKMALYSSVLVTHSVMFVSSSSLVCWR